MADDYNNINQLTDLYTRDGSGTLISHYAHMLDNTGRRAVVTELIGRTTAYGHDGLYRLKAETVFDTATALAEVLPNSSPKNRQNMKIYSVDKKSWLALDLVVDEGNEYSSFLLEVFVDLGHSSFHGKNADIHFFDVDGFVGQLSAFVIDRKIQPRLEGTYDSYLMLKGTGNRIFLSFSVGSAYCDTRTFSYAVQGAIELDSESVNSLISELSKYQE